MLADPWSVRTMLLAFLADHEDRRGALIKLKKAGKLFGQGFA